MRLYQNLASSKLQIPENQRHYRIFCKMRFDKKNTKAMGEICSSLTIKTPEWLEWQISNIAPVFPLLILKK